MPAPVPHRWPLLARSRLVADIERQLTTVSPACPGVLLSGPPGAGASVLLDLVARRHPGLIVRHHRVRPLDGGGDSRPLGDLRPLVTDLPGDALLCVDGLEELDDDTAAAVAELATARRIPVLATAGARTAAGLVTSRHPLRHLQIAPVPPLSGEQAARLCTDRLGAPVEPLTLRRLLDLADGWPAPLVAVVEHNLRLGTLQPRRGLVGARSLTLPPELTGPHSHLTHSRSTAARAVLSTAALGSMTREHAETLLEAEDLDDLITDGLLQTTVEGGAVLVELTARSRDLAVAVPPDLPDRVTAVRAALRAARTGEARDLAARLHDDGVRARRFRETAVGAALLAEAQLDRGDLAAAEHAAQQTLCLLEVASPTDPLLPECLALAAVCAAWRSDAARARDLADQAERHLQSSGGRAAARLAEMDLILGDRHGAARRARRVAASATSPDITMAAHLVLARVSEGHGTPGAEAVTDAFLSRLVRALHAGDGPALLDLARASAAAGSALLAADTAARAEPLLRSAGAVAAAGRAGHLVATVLAAVGIDRPAGWPSSTVGGLTSREREVADLITGGASAAEVAAALQLSVRTVENHLQHCYTKYGVRGRQELAQALGPLRRPSVPDRSPARPASRAALFPVGTRNAAPATRVPVAAERAGR